jgi:protein TonB
LTPTYRRIGFLVSALLHLAVIIVFLSHTDTSFEQNDDDTNVPLSLAMFQEAEPPAPVPEPAPEIPAKAKPDKVIHEAKIPQPAIKPRPKLVSPDQPVIEPAVEPEPDTTNDRGTVADTVPKVEPVHKEIDADKTSLNAQYESLKQRYLRTLLKRIHRKKHYPRRARRNREEGEVLVSFVIGKSGDISGIRINRSSGYTNLDKAAVKTLARVSPLQPLPGELGMTKWELAVPIAFNLRK